MPSRLIIAQRWLHRLWAQYIHDESLAPAAQNAIIKTLSQPRLSKYVDAAEGDAARALDLYVGNSHVSMAFFGDLHYTEVVLRNRFNEQLTAAYGDQWFTAVPLLKIIGKRNRDILSKAQHHAGGYAVPSGKVVAELTFGFWVNLTDPNLEHTLWIPVLHKAFLPNKPPKRAELNRDLEKLRQLRNRVAHHEPIFMMDLVLLHRLLCDVTKRLCPDTAHWMMANSSTRVEIERLMRKLD
jgi:Abi-like protein.